MKKNVNGIDVEMTAEEISAREAEEALNATEKQADIDAQTEKDNLKASAKAKLIAGEALTEDEANTIVI